MAKRPAPKRREAQAPAPLPYGERFYGAGPTPTLYNGQASVLAAPVNTLPLVNTASGQNSPNAAPHANAANMLGATEASLLPGPENPMAVFAQTHPRFPGQEGQG